MNRQTLYIPLALLCVAFMATPLVAQGPGPGTTPDWSQVKERITWHATWKSGLKMAQATKRPILLVSAAPSCGGISGMW